MAPLFSGLCFGEQLVSQRTPGLFICYSQWPTFTCSICGLRYDGCWDQKRWPEAPGFLCDDHKPPTVRAPRPELGPKEARALSAIALVLILLAVAVVAR